MKEKIEGIVKVSPKGQIVIPKEVRKKLGISEGEKLLILSRGKEIFFKKNRGISNGRNRRKDRSNSK